MSFFSFSSLNLRSTSFPNDPKLWPPDATLVTHYGQKLLWCPRHSNSGGLHMSSTDLEPYRMEGDDEMDTILRLLQKEGRSVGPADDVLRCAQEASTKAQALSSSSSSLSSLSTADTALAAFYHRYSEIPEWVDVAQLQRGQQVYLAYPSAIGLSQYYRSLVPGFSIPKIAAVLQSTRYLAPPSNREQVVSRLVDTGALFAACVGEDSAAGLLPGGDGWKAALQVRVLHAKIRKALGSNPKWNEFEYGIAINQEDMAATLLALFANSLLGCEMVLGFPLPMQERLDFQAFWRYLGWLLGVRVIGDYDDDGDDDDGRDNDNRNNKKMMKRKKRLLRPLDPCGPGWDGGSSVPSLKHSEAIFQSIILHILEPDHTSVEIAHHLLNIGRFEVGKSKQQTTTTTTTTERVKRNDSINKKSKKKIYDNWFYYRSLLCRRFIGDPLADALQLQYHPSPYRRTWFWMLTTLQLLLVRVYTMAALPWSPLRPFMIRFHQRIFRKFVQRWQTLHPMRMKRKMAASSRKPSSSTTSSSSICPFAMVEPPRFAVTVQKT